MSRGCPHPHWGPHSPPWSMAQPRYSSAQRRPAWARGAGAGAWVPAATGAPRGPTSCRSARPQPALAASAPEGVAVGGPHLAHVEVHLLAQVLHVGSRAGVGAGHAHGRHPLVCLTELSAARCGRTAPQCSAMSHRPLSLKMRVICPGWHSTPAKQGTVGRAGRGACWGLCVHAVALWWPLEAVRAPTCSSSALNATRFLTFR